MRAALLLVAVLSACDGCSHEKGAAPNEHTWRVVHDPYAKLGPRGQQPDLDRAAAALDLVAAELGYTGVGDEFRARRNEPWVVRETMLLAHGGNDQVEAAWIDAQGSLVESLSLPPEFKLLLRQSESRVLDASRAKVAPDVLRRTRLAEIAWMLHLLARLRADAGLPTAEGF